MHADRHQSFLQVDFNFLSIKVSYKLILSELVGMIKHSQSSQSNKFVLSLHYVEKEVKDGVHFLNAGKHQSFYKLKLLLLMEVARHVENIQSIIVMQNIQMFYGVPVMLIVTCY